MTSTTRLQSVEPPRSTPTALIHAWRKIPPLSNRFGIDPSYRLSEQTISRATTRGSTVQFLYVVVSPLSQNVWRYLQYSTWRRPAGASVTSDGGRTRSSSILSDRQRGRLSRLRLSAADSALFDGATRLFITPRQDRTGGSDRFS